VNNRTNRCNNNYMYISWIKSISTCFGHHYAYQENCSSILILHASCRQTCITCASAECTVENSWWWAEKLPETCRVSYQNKFGNSCLCWFYCKEIPSKTFISCPSVRTVIVAHPNGCWRATEGCFLRGKAAGTWSFLFLSPYVCMAWC
jgi:hypothetical protein